MGNIGSNQTPTNQTECYIYFKEHKPAPPMVYQHQAVYRLQHTVVTAQLITCICSNGQFSFVNPSNNEKITFVSGLNDRKNKLVGIKYTDAKGFIPFPYLNSSDSTDEYYEKFNFQIINSVVVDEGREGRAICIDFYPGKEHLPSRYWLSVVDPEKINFTPIKFVQESNIFGNTKTIVKKGYIPQHEHFNTKIKITFQSINPKTMYEKQKIECKWTGKLLSFTHPVTGEKIVLGLDQKEFSQDSNQKKFVNYVSGITKVVITPDGDEYQLLAKVSKNDSDPKSYKEIVLTEGFPTDAKEPNYILQAVVVKDYGF